MSLPYLPEKQVNKVIIGSGFNDEIYKNLEKLGAEPLTSSECTNVLQGIRNHSDLEVCQLNGDTFFLSKEQTKLSNKLKSLGFKADFIDEDLNEKYPNDVLLNCVTIGKHIIYNPQTVSCKIRDFVKNSSLIEVPVTQGYTKCSIAPVSFDAFITDDISIGCRGVEFGFDVLVISKGDIKLSNFNYGFIGGATGKIAHDKMLITGKAENLSDYDKINKFLIKHDVELISLTQGDVIDVGSIIPLEI